VVLATAHLGDFEYAAARLGVIGVPITLAVERLKPERLFDLASHLRTHHGIRPVPADSPEGLRALFAALRRGEAVLLTVDRDVLGTGVEVPLFGAPARLPVGPVLLAQRSGAPVLWAFGWREHARFSRGGFLPVDLRPEGTDAQIAHVTQGAPSSGPQAIARTRARPHDREALQQALLPLVAVLERQIAAHPEQWVAALAPIWTDAPQQMEGGGAAMG
jgi:KDO2-lipid IV(A) lauroyltransferase